MHRRRKVFLPRCHGRLRLRLRLRLVHLPYEVAWMTSIGRKDSFEMPSVIEAEFCTGKDANAPAQTENVASPRMPA
jgi:hypothetical protein